MGLFSSLQKWGRRGGRERRTPIAREPREIGRRATKIASGGATVWRRRGGRRPGGPPPSRSLGSSSAQRGIACGQRGWKRHPRRRVERARHLAGQDDLLALLLGMRRQRRREEGLGVGVLRRLGDRRRVARLHDLPEVHDGDRVAHVGDRGQVVRDEEVGEPELGLQVAEQVQDLRADGHVERRHRLVEHDELGRQRRAPARWRCAAAGRPRTRGGRGPPSGRVVPRAPGAGARGASPRRLSSFSLVTSGSMMMEPTRIRGFSEAKGSWKTACTERRYSRSPGPPRACRSRPSKRMTPPVGCSRQKHELGGRGLAAARLTHEAERPTGWDLEGDAVHRAHHRPGSPRTVRASP